MKHTAWVFCRLTVTGAGFGRKQCGAGWDGLRMRVGSVRGGSGQKFSNSCGCRTGAEKS